MATVVFQSTSLADTILHEICATPNLEGGVGAVIVWWEPENGVNAVCYSIGADGRCLVAHPWKEVDVDWLEAYMNEWIQAGTVQILDSVPADWQYPQEITNG